jgi:hypothetical protein
MCVAISGCGATAKPEVGSPAAAPYQQNHLATLSPRRVAFECLRANHVDAADVTTTGGHPAIQAGPLPTGPTIIYEPTPGFAEGLKITGQAQGAELINNVLLYPNEASLSQAKIVEKCAALG